MLCVVFWLFLIWGVFTVVFSHLCLSKFRYDLNQIPYDYIVEVRNTFKGLDLIDRVPDELWTEVCDIVQEKESRSFPRKINA